MQQTLQLFTDLHLAGIEPEDVMIQSFTDKKNGDIDYLARDFNYSPDEVKQMNDRGAAICWCINPQSKKNFRSKTTTTRLSVFGLDLDAGKEGKTDKETIVTGKKKILEALNGLAFQPTGIIESKHGYHPYWVFSNGPKLTGEADERGALFMQLRDGFQTKTSLQSEGDGVCRVLRLPGTLHQKNPDDTFVISEVGGTEKAVDFTAFSNEYLLLTTTPAQNNSFKEVRGMDSIYDIPVREALEKLSGMDLVNGETYTFQQNANGTLQIIVNGQPHSCWLDLKENTIGARSGGSPVNIVGWVKYYNPKMSDEDIRKRLDEVFEMKKKEAGFGFVTLKDVYAMHFNPESWLIDKILLETGINMFVGESGCGKSFLTLSIVKSLLTRKEFLGNFAVKASPKILLMDKENGLKRFQKRLKGLQCPESTRVIWMDKPEMFSLKDDTCVSKMRDYITTNGIGLVIVDSFVDFLIGQENSAEDVSETFNRLRQISSTVSWLIIHHSNKPGLFSRTTSQKTRGSSNIPAQVDSSFFMAKEGGSDNLYSIEQSKSRDFDCLKKFEVKFISSSDFADVADIEYQGEVDEPLRTVEKAKDIIYECINKSNLPVTRKDLRAMSETSKIKDRAFTDAIRILKETRLIQCDDSQKIHAYFI